MATLSDVYAPQPHELRIGRGPHDAKAQQLAMAVARLLILRDGVPATSTVVIHDATDTYLKTILARHTGQSTTGLRAGLDYEVTLDEFTQAVLPL